MILHLLVYEATCFIGHGLWMSLSVPSGHLLGKMISRCHPISLPRIHPRGDPKAFSIEPGALGWLSMDCESLEKAFAKQSITLPARATGLCLTGSQELLAGSQRQKMGANPGDMHSEHGFFMSTTNPVHLLPPVKLLLGPTHGWVGARSTWSYYCPRTENWCEGLSSDGW